MNIKPGQAVVPKQVTVDFLLPSVRLSTGDNIFYAVKKPINMLLQLLKGVAAVYCPNALNNLYVRFAVNVVCFEEAASIKVLKKSETNDLLVKLINLTEDVAGGNTVQGIATDALELRHFTISSSNLKLALDDLPGKSINNSGILWQPAGYPRSFISLKGALYLTYVNKVPGTNLNRLISLYIYYVQVLCPLYYTHYLAETYDATPGVDYDGPKDIGKCNLGLIPDVYSGFKNYIQSIDPRICVPPPNYCDATAPATPFLLPYSMGFNIDFVNSIIENDKDAFYWKQVQAIKNIYKLA